MLSHECPLSLVQAKAEGCFQRDFLFGRDDLSTDGYPLDSTEDRERRGGRGVRVEGECEGKCVCSPLLYIVRV